MPLAGKNSGFDLKQQIVGMNNGVGQGARSVGRGAWENGDRKTEKEGAWGEDVRRR